MARAIFNEERCKGCGLCVDACPKGIVAVSYTHLDVYKRQSETGAWEPCAGFFPK